MDDFSSHRSLEAIGGSPGVVRPAGSSPSSAVDRDAEGRGARFAERLRANELSEPGAGRFDEPAARPAEEPRPRSAEADERAPDASERRRGEEARRAEVNPSERPSGADAAGERADETSSLGDDELADAGVDAGADSDVAAEDELDEEGVPSEAPPPEVAAGDEGTDASHDVDTPPADADGTLIQSLPGPAPVVAAASAFAAGAKASVSATPVAGQPNVDGAASSQAIAASGGAEGGAHGQPRDSEARADSGTETFADAFEALASTATAEGPGAEIRSAFSVTDVAAPSAGDGVAPTPTSSVPLGPQAVQSPAAGAPASAEAGGFIETRLADVERAAAILDQVRVHLRPGTREATLSLEPESLGRLRVRVQVHDGKLTAELRVERPEAFAALEKHMPELRAAFADSGIETERLEVMLGFEHGDTSAEREGAPRQGASNGGRERGENADLPAWSPSALRDRLAHRITDRGVDTYA